MRIIAAIVLLLMLVAASYGPVAASYGPVAAADASPHATFEATPAPDLVEEFGAAAVANPVCAQAFLAAASAPIEAPPTTDPGDADAADGDETAALVPDRLDAAIRACSSVQDWVMASSEHPEALGGHDALTLLLERCSDASTGLDAYATCQSMAIAAATPTPIPTPVPLPAPTAEPTARPPAGGNQTPNTSRPATQRPDAQGRVRLPKKLSAKVPGATTIRYFSVGGKTAGTLVTQTLKRAKPHCGIHRALACVNLSWRVTTSQANSSGVCRIVGVSWTLRATVHLPRWTKPKRVDAELLGWWRRVLKQSAKHEAKHIKIQQAQLAKLRTELVGKPCSSFGKVLKRIQRRSTQAQAAFDRREATKPLPPAP